jgi:hypothetical protein
MEFGAFRGMGIHLKPDVSRILCVKLTLPPTAAQPSISTAGENAAGRKCRDGAGLGVWTGEIVADGADQRCSSGGRRPSAHEPASRPTGLRRGRYPS